MRAAAAVVLGAVLLHAGCAPALNWRDVRPPGSGLLAQLPCKPASQVRSVKLAGAAVSMTVLACDAGGATWSLAWADVAEPAQVGPALAALREAALNNLGAGAATPLPLAVKGSTQHVQAARVSFSGKLPSGTAVQAQSAVFAKALRVFQASALGAELDAAAAQVYFDALSL